MDFIENDVLSGEIVPVLLGLSPETQETARRMFRRYGVVSHVFCDRVPFLARLSLSAKYHSIHHENAGDRLMLEALLDFAEQLENADLILYLIPCTEQSASLLWKHRDRLEGSYVIADRKELECVLFGRTQPIREVTK